MFTLFRCFTEACENYEGDPIPEQLYLEKLGYVYDFENMFPFFQVLNSVR